MKKSSSKKSAFSLIELSIVLIIIGLLIAGVTGGASLIRSSELRAVMGEARSFATAVNGFYTQFNALPGDYNVALSGLGTGDMNGQIQYGKTCATGSSCTEGSNAWQQLVKANVIDSTIVGATAAIDNTANAPTFTGTTNNAPASKVKASGWVFDYRTTETTSMQNVVVLTGTITVNATATAYTGSSIHTNSPTNGATVSAAALVPADALSIDTKIDDGVANTGKVRGVNTGNTNGCSGGTAGTSNSTTALAVPGATYTTATATKACALSYQVDVNS